MNQKRLLMLAGACALSLLLVGCARPGNGGKPGPAERVRIGATTLPASAPVFVAQEQGYFADEGLDAKVDVYDAGIVALGDAIEGKIDFATVAETPLTRAALEGAKFDVLMTMAEVDRANYIVARRDRGVANAADLKGKRIGYVPGSTGDFFLHIYLTASGIRDSEVTKVALKASETVSAVVSGTADAAAIWPPYTIQLERRLGPNATVLDEPGLYTMSWNLAAGTGDKGVPRAVQERVIRALVRAERYMEDHPGEAMSVTAEKCGLDVADVRRVWNDFEWTASLDQSLLLSLEDEARWMIDTGQVKGAEKVPDFLGYVDSAALQRVRPAEVTIVEPNR